MGGVKLREGIFYIVKKVDGKRVRGIFDVQALKNGKNVL